MICAVLTLLPALPVAAQANTISLQIDSPYMEVNGVPRLIDDHGSVPQIIDGRTVAPLRPVIEAMGGTVLWDAELLLLTIRDDLGEREIILKINSYDSVVNAQTGPRLDVAPLLVDNVTMTPLMFVALHMGFELDWDEATRTVTIAKPSP